MGIFVVFFGGYKASQPDMNQWQASAEAQRGDVEFDSYPYPAAASFHKQSAVDGFGKQFDDVIQCIADVGADTLYIVGHSSGCAIANSLNSRLDGDHNKITLIDLDGFSPSADQIKGSSVQVWSAVGAGGKGKSVNWAASHKIYTSGRATQPWSLHFSLVNTAASDAITEANFASKGYAGCMANLCWLTKRA
jgi:hypothetical protein